MLRLNLTAGRINLFFLSFFFLISTNFVLLGDYHIGYGSNGPPRDPAQDVRDRCNVNGRPSKTSMRNLKKIELQNIELSYDCSDQRYSPEEIVQNFCTNEKAKEYIDFDVDFSTLENSLNTIHALRSQIDDPKSGHKLRKKCIRNGANRGRHKKYFDNKLDEYKKQLIDILMVYEKRYRVSTNLEKHGHEYGIDPSILESFSGNKTQHRFHKRILESLDRSFNIPTSDIKTLSIGSLKCAYAANRVRKNSLTESCLNFANSLLYLAKRAGGGIAMGGIDFSRAVAYMLGNDELPSDTSSISEIFAKIKEQPLEGVGDGLEYAVRTVTFGGAIFVSYLLGLEVAAVGVGAAKGIVAATQFLKPFLVGISTSGAATLEYSLAPAKDFVQASVVTVGQAAQVICGVAEQCGHLFAAANGGPVGEKNKVLGRGSTADLSKGTTLPRNLEEQLAIQEVIADPASGFELPFEMTDTRWPSSGGWIKMQYIHHIRDGKINVHYVYNKVTGMVDDFKIKL